MSSLILPSARRRNTGASLVELVITIAVLGIAAVAILSAMNVTTAASADPVLQSQAQYVARAYLEEILAQGYSDPDAVEAGENRASFDDVDDYNGLSVNGCLSTSAACPSLGTCACDQAGAPMDDLKGYTVTVAVAPTTLGAVGALRVDVNVRHTVHPNVNVTFSSYRTNY